MFKKQLVVVLLFGLLCTALIGYSALNVSNSSATFSESGYVHVSATENSDKRILFNSGTTYKKRVDDTISFNDSLGEQSNVSLENFIHFDDLSLSSFVDGVLVDLDELSNNNSMQHYALPSNTILSKNGSSYSVLNSSQNYSFNNFIWKINENKYLFVSPNMILRIGDDDQRNISNYAEITYIGDSLIQIQTEDNIWQTISDECHLFTSNSLDVDLSDRAVQNGVDEDGKDIVLLDFSRIVVNSEDNVEFSPIIANKNGETVIPHFDITAEDGADGISGTVGSNGGAGDSGTSGRQGQSGEKGDDGADGGEAGSFQLSAEVKDFPVFTLTEWTVRDTACTGSFKITETLEKMKNADGEETGAFYPSMLNYGDGTGSRIYIQDQNTGAEIEVNYDGDAFINFCKTESKHNKEDEIFGFSCDTLEADHSYLLVVEAVTSYDYGATTYPRPYISKIFWTDSLGAHLEKTSSSENSIGFCLILDDGIFKEYDNVEAVHSSFGYNVFDSYQDAASASPDSPYPFEFDDDDDTTGFVFRNKRPDHETDLTSNTKQYVRLAYYLPGMARYKYTSQILEVSTLKKKASISTPILIANSTISGFDVNPGVLVDDDNSFVSCTYEFYERATGNDDSPNLGKGPVAKAESSVFDFKTVAIGPGFERGKKYCVKTIATFFDGEKNYTLESDYSNFVLLNSAIRPQMFFRYYTGTGEEQETIVGTNVKFKNYESIVGEIVVQPDAGGGYFGLIGARTLSGAQIDGLNVSTLIIKKDGYYYGEYPILLETEAGEIIDTGSYKDGQYVVGQYDENKTLTIKLNDPLDTIESLYNNVDEAEDHKFNIGGLQPNSTYELIVYGDVVNGSTGEIDLNNIQIGRCMITTSDIASLLADFTIPADRRTETISEGLRGVKLSLEKMNDSNETSYERMSSSGEYTEDNTNDYLFGTVKRIQIDLFEGIVEESILESDENYPQNPLSSKTLDVSNVSDRNAISKLFSDDGLELGFEFFFGSKEFGEVALGNIKEVTIYAKEVEDYAYDVYQSKFETLFGTGVQKKYFGYIANDKILLNNSTNYGYRNLLRAGNPDTDPTVKLLNKSLFEGDTRRACYMSDLKTIESLTVKPWEEVRYEEDDKKIGKYYLNPNYNNTYMFAQSITYYVYDAVDFYTNKDQITIKDRNGDLPATYEYKAEYNNNEAKVYSVNTDILNFVAGTDDDVHDNNSKVFDFEVPVLLDGLELAKRTINIEYPLTPDGDLINTDIPNACFVPMTKETYREAYGLVNVPDTFGDYYAIYLDDDIHHFTDENKNSQLSLEKGHQYVICWTINVLAPSGEGEGTGSVYQVYPFDSYYSYSSSDTDLQNVDLNADGKISYSEIASGLSDKAMAQYTGFKTNSLYYDDNPYCVFGHDGYMLIPHTVMSNDNYSLDKYRGNPNANALLWEIDENKVTAKITLYDNNENSLKIKGTAPVTTQSGTKTVPVAYLYDTTTYREALELDEDVFVKEGLSTSNETEMDNLLKYNNESDGSNNNYVSTITVDRTNDDNNNLMVSVGIQKYNDKYTTDNDPTHTNYVKKSNDGNWDISNPSNQEALRKYYELFSTSLNKDEANNKEEIEGALGDSNKQPTGYFYWNYGSNSKIDYGYMAIDIIPSLFKKISGFRIHFEYNGEDFYVDKMLTSIDTFENEGETSADKHNVFAVDEINGIYRVRFRISVPLELISSSYDGEKRIADIEDANAGTVKEYTYPNFLNQVVNVRFELLYPTSKGGYKYISNTYKHASEGFSDSTFGLKENITTVQSDGSVTFDGAGYYAFKETSVGGNLLLSENAYKTNISNYTKNMGSFFYLRLTEGRIGVESTRWWSNGYDDLNPLSTNRELSVDVERKGDNVFTSTRVVPIKMVASNSYKSDQFKVKSYDNGSIPFNLDKTVKTDNLRTGNLDSTVQFPGTDPYITYHNLTDAVIKSLDPYTIGTTVSFSGWSNDGVVGSTPDTETLYVSVTRGSISPNYVLTNLSFVALSPDIIKDENKNIYTLKTIHNNNDANRINITELQSQKEPDHFNEDHVFDNLINSYIRPIKVSDYRDKNYSVNFRVTDCVPGSKAYRIVFWRYVKNGPTTYQLMPVDMFKDAERTQNYKILTTKNLPTSPVSIRYSVASDSRSFVYTNFNLDKNHYDFDPSDYYTLIELRDNNNELLTYVYCGDHKESDSFDLDGVGSGPFIYKNTSIDTTSHKLIHANNELFNFIFGKEYKLVFRVYKNNHGPAWGGGSDDDQYALFIDKTSLPSYRPDDGLSSANIISNNPSKNLLLTNLEDDPGRLSNPVAHLSVNSISYYTIALGNLTLNSGTLREGRYLPVAIREHKTESGDKEYYDISGLLQYTGVGSNGKFVSPNSTIRLDVTRDAGDGQFEDVFVPNDIIHIYFFARQLGQVGQGSAFVNTLTFGERVYTEGSGINSVSGSDTVLTVNNVLLGRTYTPNYSTSPIKIDSNQYNNLKIGEKYTQSTIGTGDNKGTVSSKLLFSTDFVVPNIRINLGKVTVSPSLTSDSEFVAIFENSSMMELISRAEYDVMEYVFEGDSTQISTLSEVPKFDSDDYPVHVMNFSDRTSDMPFMNIDLTKFKNKVDPQVAAANPKQIHNRYIITLKFYTNLSGVEEAIAFADSTRQIPGQVLSDDNTTLTVTYYVNEAAKKLHDDYKDYHANNNALSFTNIFQSIKNGLNDMIDVILPKDGDDNE